MDFHLLLLSSCGNRVTEVFAAVVRTYFQSTRHAVEKAPRAFFERSADHCDDLLKALVRGDRNEAENILELMISESHPGS